MRTFPIFLLEPPRSCDEFLDTSKRINEDMVYTFTSRRPVGDITVDVSGER